MYMYMYMYTYSYDLDRHTTQYHDTIKLYQYSAPVPCSHFPTLGRSLSTGKGEIKGLGEITCMTLPPFSTLRSLNA
jgi:hypothetical protein